MSVDQLLDMVRDWRPLVVVTEAGGLKNAIGPFLKERMNQRKIYTAVETIPSRHAKEIRAQSSRGVWRCADFFCRGRSHGSKPSDQKS